MARKTNADDTSPFQFIGDIIKHILDGAINSLVASALEDFKTTATQIQQNFKTTMKQVQREFMQTFQRTIYLMIGILFLLIATIQLVPEYLDIHKGWVYLGIGILLLFVSTTFRPRRRYYYSDR